MVTLGHRFISVGVSEKPVKDYNATI